MADGYAVRESDGVRLLVLAPEGSTLSSLQDALDCIGIAFEHGAGLVAIPVSRLSEDFFRLRTRLAGEMMQKFVQYQRRVAIVGDVSRYVAESSAFEAFVLEANRGRDLCFVSDFEKLDARLVSLRTA